MSFFRNNIVAIHATLVVCGFAWLFGGLRGSVLVPVMPWLWALLMEAMLFFPQRRSGEESTYQARERVWASLRRDPMVWVELVLLVLLTIPFANTGLCPACDVAAIAEGMDPSPYVTFLPYCVNPSHHLTVFLWFVPALTAMTAVKHSLTKSGKRTFCEMVVWNAAVLALLGFVQQVAGAPGPLWSPTGRGSSEVYFFSTFGYPNAGGSFFASVFALSVAVWRRRADDVRAECAEKSEGRTEARHKVFWRKHYMIFPTLLLFVAALNTLSRAAIMLATSSAVLLALHAAVCTLARMHRAQRVKASAVMALAIVALLVLASLFTPQKLRNEMRTVSTIEALDRVTNRGEYHSRVAMDLFWDHPLFGCGGWGYAHLSPTKMTEEELVGVRAGWARGSANVHNDYLQFIVEHGAVGFGCLVAIAVMLLIPVGRVWKALAKAARFADAKHAPPSPHAIFALPPGAFAVLVAVLVILIHAFGDCPLRSPAVLALLYTELAAVDGFLPRIKTREEGEKNS